MTTEDRRRLKRALTKALTVNEVVIMDASLAVDIVIGSPERAAQAAVFLEVCGQRKVQLIAPPTYPGEIDTALRQNVLRGPLPAEDLPQAYAALDTLPVEIVFDEAEFWAVRVRARQIAEMMTQSSVYDATYAALAEARGGTFWTVDKTFANAAQQKRRTPDGRRIVATLPIVRLLSDFV